MAAKFRAGYIQKYGLNQERDFSLLKDIINKHTKHYVAILTAVAKNREQTDLVNSSKSMSDIANLVSTTISEVSDTYRNILLIYFGTMENIVNYVTLEYNVIQHAVIECNKQKISQIRNVPI